AAPGPGPGPPRPPAPPPLWPAAPPGPSSGRRRSPLPRSAIAMPAAELFDLGIAELGRRYREKALSPVDVAPAYLGRIDALDKALGSYVTVTHDRALADARSAEAAIREGAAGPLSGIPIAYKDLYATRGVLTTGGSALLADWVPDHDATC